MSYTKFNRLFMSGVLITVLANFAIWWSFGSYLITTYLSGLILPYAQENPEFTYTFMGSVVLGTTWCQTCFKRIYRKTNV